MPPRTRSGTRPLAAWGFRPPCARAEQQAYDDVLLAQDLQISILETVGVLGIGLGAINKSWSVIVAGRRKKTWKILAREPAKSFGGEGTASEPTQLSIQARLNLGGGARARWVFGPTPLPGRGSGAIGASAECSFEGD